MPPPRARRRSADSRPPTNDHRRLVTDPADADALYDEIRQARIFGLDTEFVSEHTYQPQLALAQVATPDRILILDPLQLPPLAGLWELAADPQIEIVMHAGEQESRFCWLETGSLPTNVFDVQIAAGLLGHRFPIAYHSLVRAVLNRHAEQGQTRSDWMRRPLSDRQLAYAADDVDHLIPLRDTLGAALDQRTRLPWLDDETNHRDDQLLAELTQDRWWRVTGAQKLGRRDLAAVRELFLWREDLARSRDLPRRRVLRDDLIIAAAQAAPTDLDDLQRVRGMERLPHRDRPGLLDAIQTAQNLPPQELPQKHRSDSSAPSQARMLALTLEALLESICIEREVAPSLVGGAGDLRRLIDWHLAGRDGEVLPRLLTGWRAEVCGQLLEDALAGRVRIRVGDPASDHPLVVEPASPLRLPSPFPGKGRRAGEEGLGEHRHF